MFFPHRLFFGMQNFNFWIFQRKKDDEEKKIATEKKTVECPAPAIETEK